MRDHERCDEITQLIADLTTRQTEITRLQTQSTRIAAEREEALRENKSSEAYWRDRNREVSTDRDSLKRQLDAAAKVGTIKPLAAEDMPQLLALGKEWSNLHDSFLRGVTDGAESQMAELTTRTLNFLAQKLDESHAAMVENVTPEHPNLPGRQTRDRHFMGMAAAKLNKVNQIIEEQRRGS